MNISRITILWIANLVSMLRRWIRLGGREGRILAPRSPL